MKTIGLIAGMSWHSSLEYYRMINELTNKKMGKHHCAKIVMYNVDFEEIINCQRNGDWEKATSIIGEAAQSLEKAGCDFVMICTNTMHKIADGVQAQINIPLIHICDAISEKVLEKGIKKVGLLGTKYTMQQDFYCNRFSSFCIEAIIPDADDVEYINNVIFNQLCQGEFLDESREKFTEIIQKLVANGAEGIILGCTEILLLINQDNSPVPVFDTTYYHSLKAVELALTPEATASL